GSGEVVREPHKGALGAWLAEHLVPSFGPVLSGCLVWITTFGALLLATDFFFHEAFERLRRSAARAPEAGVEPEGTDHLKGLALDQAGAAPLEIREGRKPRAAQPPPATGEPAHEAMPEDVEVDVEPIVGTPPEPSTYRAR